jgi:hypothetical protein
MSRPAVMNVLALSLTIAAGPCRHAPRRATNTTERNAVIAHYRALATEMRVQSSLARLASGKLPLDTIPALVGFMCSEQCETAYFQCVEHTMPGLTIPGSDHRAPKEFPVEIPECTDPDCGGASIASQPETRSCEDARAACQKACDCRAIARAPTPSH